MPLEISEWKPEIAPQAMVMKQNGKIFPATTGPEPSTKRRQRRHLQIRQHQQRFRSASAKIVPSFMNVLR